MLLASLPYGAVAQDTAEFMLGNVVATVVLLESDGSIDPSTKDWNQLVRDQLGNPVLDGNGDTISVAGPNYIELTKDRIEEGLQWWEDTLVNFYARNYADQEPIHGLNFILDFQYAHNPVATGYEPIDRISNDYSLWVPDFLQAVGFWDTGVIDADIRAFNNAQRLKYNADWAYTIFVVNDYGDTDLRFKDGGSFSQAFAFSGGRFLVAPSQRPASTFAHESGHMFYALDEYAPAGSYLSRRGYYNTQNLNSWDNPDPNYADQASIMYNGPLLLVAWQNHISADTTLAMIGWQDSDADGVFDVLDRPLTLTGTGRYSPVTGLYEFAGHSMVETLPNVNSAGRRNDITLNKVSRAVYSLDGGATWLVGGTYGLYETDIAFTVAMQLGQEILVRTESVDPLTGQIVTTSGDVFWGTTDFPTALTDSGIQGFVWYDQDNNNVWDVTERGLSGWTVRLVDVAGQPIQLQKLVEPDDYAQHALLGSVVNGVTLSVGGFTDYSVGAIEASPAATGSKVFGAVRAGKWVTDWTAETYNLRVDLASPTTTISIDAVGPASGGYGRLEIFGAGGTLLGRYTTRFLAAGEVETMTLAVPSAQITYAIAKSTIDSSVRLDNLRVGPASSATTSVGGAYMMPHLPAGSYRVQAVPTSDWLLADPVSGIRQVTVDADGDMAWGEGAPRPSDFAAVLSPTAPPWRNPVDALDVNNDVFLSPIDALQVINVLNREGSHALPPPAGGSVPPPFLDVTGDNFVSPIDALLVINELNRPSSGGGGSGEGSSSGDSGGSGSGGGVLGGPSEGESWAVDTESRLSDAVDRAPDTGRSSDTQHAAHDDASLRAGPLSARTLPIDDALALVAADVVRVRRKATILDEPTQVADDWTNLAEEPVWLKW